MIITIDGPVATGKSTIAKELAKETGFIFFDTGAMYRSVTYAIYKQHIDPNNNKQLTDFLENFVFEIKIKQGEKRYFVGEEDVTEEIRKPEVTAHVSEIAAIPSIRSKLVAIQRKTAKGVNAIFEGRDMGTVVFPNAEVKIFLTGSPEVRARRRFDELRAKFPDDTQNLTLEEALHDLNRRDAYDSTREISPLKQADDAHVIDTSDLTIDEVVYKILEIKR